MCSLDVLNSTSRANVGLQIPPCFSRYRRNPCRGDHSQDVNPDSSDKSGRSPLMGYGKS